MENQPEAFGNLEGASVPDQSTEYDTSQPLNVEVHVVSGGTVTSSDVENVGPPLISNDPPTSHGAVSSAVPNSKTSKHELKAQQENSQDAPSTVSINLEQVGHSEEDVHVAQNDEACGNLDDPPHTQAESEGMLCKVDNVRSISEPKDTAEQVSKIVKEEAAASCDECENHYTSLKSEILQEGEDDYLVDSRKKLPRKTSQSKRTMYHFPEHNSKLAQFAACMRMENKLTDISVCCSGSVIMAHRLVLVAHSKVLCSIIGADQNCNYISLDNFSIPGDVTSIILDYIYTGMLEITEEEKPLVLEAAKLLDIPDLVTLLETPPTVRKRGRPRRMNSVSPPVRTKKAKTVTAKVKESKAVPVIASQKRKRGRPRKCAAVHSILEESEEDVGNTNQDKAQKDLLQKTYEELSALVNDDDEDEDEAYNVTHEDNSEPALDPKDTDFNPKKPSVVLRKPRSAKKSKVAINTRGLKTTKSGKRGRPRKAEVQEKKKKPTLTPEQMEEKRIALEKKRNRPKPIKTPEGMFKCPLEGCAYISHTDSFIYNHIRNHSDERPFPCTICEKRFKMKKHLDVHIRVHTGERPYACEVCGKAFKASKHRNRHRRVHTAFLSGEKIGFCEECGKGFSSRNQLNRHIAAVHRRERPYKCDHPECKYAAADKSTLRQHRLQHTRDPTNPDAAKDILCEVCGKGFLSHNSLRLHRLSHTGADIQCSFCDYVSKYKSAMDSHLMRRHGRTLSGKAAEKRWRCDQCVYACFTENEFNMHMMKHRGEKPHKCPICDFGTVDKGTLKKHLRHHTGEMPFTCKVCTKAFSSQSGLARHTRIHLGIKPHKCDQCEKCYADRKSLKAHQFTHLNIKPFECHICCYACVKKEYLLKHIEKTHGEQSIPENMRPNPENKKYRPKNLFQGQQVNQDTIQSREESSIQADSIAESSDSLNVIVEEANPQADVVVAVDYSRGGHNPSYVEQSTSGHAQLVHYATMGELAVQGLVDAYNSQAPVYTLSQYNGTP